jgi:hypothetical protein
MSTVRDSSEISPSTLPGTSARVTVNSVVTALKPIELISLSSSQKRATHSMYNRNYAAGGGRTGVEPRRDVRPKPKCTCPKCTRRNSPHTLENCWSRQADERNAERRQQPDGSAADATQSLMDRAGSHPEHIEEEPSPSDLSEGE